MLHTLVDRYFARAAAPDLDAYLAQSPTMPWPRPRACFIRASVPSGRGGPASPPVSYTVKSVEPTGEGHRPRARASLALHTQRSLRSRMAKLFDAATNPAAPGGVWVPRGAGRPAPPGSVTSQSRGTMIESGT